MDFSIVTVAHDIDLPLLKLQARSLNRYLAHDFIREIIVVDNSTGGASLDRTQLLPQYGQRSVRIIKAADIAVLPSGVSGWFTQQVYKLMIANHISTKNYILLDAKNHLIGPVLRSTFEAADGRLRTGMHGYRHHPLQRYLLRCCQSFNIDPETILDTFLPTATPFCMPTGPTRQLLVDVARRDKMAFPQAFLASGMTEFFLFGTYLMHSGHGIENYYVSNTYYCAGLWKEQTNARMQHEINDAESRSFFGVHRSTFPNMDAKTQDMLALLWHRKNLFASYADALRFVRGCAITYR